MFKQENRFHWKNGVMYTNLRLLVNNTPSESVTPTIRPPVTYMLRILRYKTKRHDTFINMI